MNPEVFCFSQTQNAVVLFDVFLLFRLGAHGTQAEIIED